MKNSSTNSFVGTLIATAGLLVTLGLKLVVNRMLPAPVREDYPEALAGDPSAAKADARLHRAG
ncbi:MAG: hypothetical protein WA771_01490 [Chthoniobacterales bacterium]